MSFFMPDDYKNKWNVLLAFYYNNNEKVKNYNDFKVILNF